MNNIDKHRINRLALVANEAFLRVFPPKIGRGQFKTRPEPWAKISRGLF